MEVKTIAIVLLKMELWGVLPFDASIFDKSGIGEHMKVGSAVVVSLCILSVPPHESLPAITPVPYHVRL